MIRATAKNSGPTLIRAALEQNSTALRRMRIRRRPLFMLAQIFAASVARRSCSDAGRDHAFELVPFHLSGLTLMTSQRLLLGIGFVILAAISATSITLDRKARADAKQVDFTFEVINELSNLRIQTRSAESGARAYLLTDQQHFLDEYHQASDRVVRSLLDLKTLLAVNPVTSQLLANAEPLVVRRFVVIDEWLRLHKSGDTAGVAVRFQEGAELMASLLASLDLLAAEEVRLLGIRSDRSEETGKALLSVDLIGAVLIFLLAGILVREARLSSRKLEHALEVKANANEALEAAVAERTAHLVSAHEKLRSSAAVLDSTFRSMAEAVFVLDAGGNVVLSNSAAEQLLSRGHDAALDQSTARSETYKADGTTKLAANESPASRALHGEHFDGEEFVLRREGSPDPIHVVVSGRPLLDVAGAISGAALVYHDVTALREMERKLHHAQKLDAIGRLTGGVAHDFNNMLTVITGTIETLVDRFQDQPDLLSTVSLVDQAAQRCTELISQLLAFARKQPLQPRKIDVNATIRDTVSLLRPTLGEQIEIDSILPHDLSMALIDPSQLANALVNLAINARDAMPNGGQLLLETSNVVFDHTYTRENPDAQPGAYVMIAVSDTGTGMAPAIRDKVFEPFFTTKEVGKGTGLGLSMVYGFVKQSGGHIKIYSEEGYGTTIKIFLPAASGQADIRILPVDVISGGTETILVVEDDALVRRFASAQLRDLGYITIAVPDSRAALAHLKSGQPFDLLFTDVIMPGGMTGRQLADKVVKCRPGTGVLYTSGYSENAIMHHGRLDEGVLLLSKPYRKSELAGMVRRALEAPRPVNRAARSLRAIHGR
jgi:PAS domain S-box-containing protein